MVEALSFFTLLIHNSSGFHPTKPIMMFAVDATTLSVILDYEETHYREEIQHLATTLS